MEKEDDSMISFTSDLHFGYPGMTGMPNRPFENVQAMNPVLIRNDHAVVYKNDGVYFGRHQRTSTDGSSKWIDS